MTASAEVAGGIIGFDREIDKGQSIGIKGKEGRGVDDGERAKMETGHRGHGGCLGEERSPWDAHTSNSANVCNNV